ncbi:hypothetical protein A2442_00600 [Candidatus Campbellbacteria bacterium RIFOXYC2_FULL_35_25]|uniref:Glycosyl transferase family 1 domain-containing protein n=1 Tax=Candidatus Campbellbacteria bacterium RIFOXYC2_FULL_35_25 TaxID=1797582 RepID=A0A1F5EIK8_9BACT|nr:MAG: hypothetical protein A2442_00600 [Candidatus Campbellbacteria bacterium RIFOXYC2_FULL_35_25]
MKLLILTQKVDKNDDVLGFFHGWILEFAKNYEKVTVICLYEGKHDLPENVKVLSLGKERGVSKLKYILNFYKYIWQERAGYEQVFVHMNQVYVLLGGLFWRLWGKKVGLWYAHGSVPFSLRIAEKITNHVFTSTESGFRIDSKKKKVVGQGINLEIFKPGLNIIKPTIFSVVTVGRISPVKDYETLIKAIEKLVSGGINIKLRIIGGVVLSEQEKYFDSLKLMVRQKNLENNIIFVGPVSNSEIPKYLKESDLFVNTSHTGSLDKTVLESMACGIPILNCNEAFLEVLGGFKERLMFPKNDFVILCDKIKEMFDLGDKGRKSLGIELRNTVAGNHSIGNLIKKIKSIYE